MTEKEKQNQIGRKFKLKFIKIKKLKIKSKNES
jgi:hypothetical protein